MPEPANLVYLQELWERRCTAFLRPRRVAAGPPEQFDFWHFQRSPGAENYTTLHQQGGNLVFCDGHAKWKKGQAIRSKDFGLTPDDGWEAPVNKRYRSAF